LLLALGLGPCLPFEFLLALLLLLFDEARVILLEYSGSDEKGIQSLAATEYTLHLDKVTPEISVILGGPVLQEDEGDTLHIRIRENFVLLLLQRAMRLGGRLTVLIIIHLRVLKVVVIFAVVDSQLERVAEPAIQLEAGLRQGLDRVRLSYLGLGHVTHVLKLPLTFEGGRPIRVGLLYVQENRLY